MSISRIDYCQFRINVDWLLNWPIMLNITRCKLKKIPKKLLDFFILGVTARSAASLPGIQGNSAIFFIKKFGKSSIGIWRARARRCLMAALNLMRQDLRKTGPSQGRRPIGAYVARPCLRKSYESYLSGTRKGKRGRGAADKVVVFGVLKRNDKVRTVVIEDARTATLIPIIIKKIKPDNIVYTDSWKVYNALDVNQFRHKRINHSVCFSEGKIISIG